MSFLLFTSCFSWPTDIYAMSVAETTAEGTADILSSTDTYVSTPLVGVFSRPTVSDINSPQLCFRLSFAVYDLHAVCIKLRLVPIISTATSVAFTSEPHRGSNATACSDAVVHERQDEGVQLAIRT